MTSPSGGPDTYARPTTEGALFVPVDAPPPPSRTARTSRTARPANPDLDAVRARINNPQPPRTPTNRAERRENDGRPGRPTRSSTQPTPDDEDKTRLGGKAMPWIFGASAVTVGALLAPVWAWLALGGGAVAVGGVVAARRARRKLSRARSGLNNALGSPRGGGLRNRLRSLAGAAGLPIGKGRRAWRTPGRSRKPGLLGTAAAKHAASRSRLPTLGRNGKPLLPRSRRGGANSSSNPMFRRRGAGTHGGWPSRRSGGNSHRRDRGSKHRKHRNGGSQAESMAQLMRAKTNRAGGRKPTVAWAFRRKAANHLWSGRPVRAFGNIAASATVGLLKALRYPLVTAPVGAWVVAWHGIARPAWWAAPRAGRQTLRALRASAKWLGFGYTWTRLASGPWLKGLWSKLGPRGAKLFTVMAALASIPAPWLKRFSPARIWALVRQRAEDLGRRWGVHPAPATVTATASVPPPQPTVAPAGNNVPPAAPAAAPQREPFVVDFGQPAPAEPPVVPTAPPPPADPFVVDPPRRQPPPPATATPAVGWWVPPWERTVADQPQLQPKREYPGAIGDYADTDVDSDAPVYTGGQPIEPPARVSSSTDPTTERKDPMPTSTSLTREQRMDMAAAFVSHRVQERLTEASRQLFHNIPNNVLSMRAHLGALGEMFNECARIVARGAQHYQDTLPVKEPVLDHLMDIRKGMELAAQHAYAAQRAYEIANTDDIERHENRRPNDEFNNVPSGGTHGVRMAPLRQEFLEAFAAVFFYRPVDPPDLRAFFQGLFPMFLDCGRHVETAPMVFPGTGGAVAILYGQITAGFVQSATQAMETATSYQFTDATVLYHFDNPERDQHLVNVGRDGDE